MASTQLSGAIEYVLKVASAQRCRARDSRGKLLISRKENGGTVAIFLAPDLFSHELRAKAGNYSLSRRRLVKVIQRTKVCSMWGCYKRYSKPAENAFRILYFCMLSMKWLLQGLASGDNGGRAPMVDGVGKLFFYALAALCK